MKSFSIVVQIYYEKTSNSSTWTPLEYSNFICIYILEKKEGQ